MLLDRASQAIANEAEVDEAGAHRNFFRAEGVSVVACIKLLRFVKKGSPLYIDFFIISG